MASPHLTSRESLRISAIALLVATMLSGCGDNNSTAATDTGTTTAAKRPNILIVMADDMGASDIGAYGGEVETPTLDTLAQNGLQFTNFHTAPSCSPTRVMLLSGVDNHRSGFGTMAGRLPNPPAANQRGKPGYEGFMNDKVVTVADLLRESGYHTYMSGKWHMGKEDGYRPAQRGFEQSFALIPGGANHFIFDGIDKLPPSDELETDYRENDVKVTLPADFYSTTYYTDKIIEYIDKPRDDGQPFFGLVTYTAPHSPLQAPQEYINKYMDKYTSGWDTLRAQRFERQKALGLIPANMELPPRWSNVPAWDTQPEADRAIDAKKMAVYAGMIDYMDVSIGRIVERLKAKGEYDNTIIIFMSDNGPEANNLAGQLSSLLEPAGFDNSLANIGNGSSYVSPATGFAMVSNSPYYAAKSSIAEGGIRNNFIVSYPKGGITGARRTAAFTSVLDIMPTLLDYTNVTYPATHNGKTILSLDGRSMRTLWEGGVDSPYATDSKAVGVELFGTANKALYQDDWKLRRLGDKSWGPVATTAGLLNAEPWRLYNIKDDPFEQNDVAATYPQQLSNMIALYTAYEERVGFVPAVGFTTNPPAARSDMFASGATEADAVVHQPRQLTLKDLIEDEAD